MGLFQIVGGGLLIAALVGFIVLRRCHL